MMKQPNRLEFPETTNPPRKRNAKVKPFGYQDGIRSLTFRERLAKERINKIEQNKNANPPVALIPTTQASAPVLPLNS